MSPPVSSNAVDPQPKLKKAMVSSSLPLPDDVSLICFAHVPRRNYPSLSLVSKSFGSLIANSSELNRIRSLHQRTENVLYIALRSSHEENPTWYTLNQKPYENESNDSLHHKLVPFPSFPSMPRWGSSVIVIGQEIYVLGGCINGEVTTNSFAIDCISHTCRSLPSMRVARGCAASGVVGEKIYVIGGCHKTKSSLSDWVEVFDLKKQSWECFSGLCNEELHEITINSFVMNKKIYVQDSSKSFVYDPKKNRWEKAKSLNGEWQVGSCVIDNMLYTFGNENRTRVYDPRVKSWRFLNGVEEDLPDMRRAIGGSRMANHGGKLAILFMVYDNRGRTQVWCTEIALERRSRREIWGKVLWSNHVISFTDPPTIVRCLDVLI